MAISRYVRSPILKLSKQYGTSTVIQAIRSAVKSGDIKFVEIILPDGARLDTLAGQFYAAGDLWWAIAAASDIGWGLQVPGGTRIRVPDMKDLLKFIG